MSTSNRLERVPASMTLAITAKAAELRAQGKDVIGFGAGEPDFPTPDNIVAAAQRAAADPAAHHYTPAAGLPALREAVADKTRRDSGLDRPPDGVVITNGGKGAVHGAIQALIDPGDEVLIPAPYWVSYPHMVTLAEGVPVVVPSGIGSGFKVGVEDLERAATDRTKALIFVSPSNPTGAVYRREEVVAIGRWAADRGIWVIADEIYQHLVFGATPFSSLPVEVPEAADRCVVVSGVAKTYAMTGWRVGWAVAPREVAAAMIRYQSHTASNVSNVAQAAALEAVTGPQDAVAAMKEAFAGRSVIMHELLTAIPGVRAIRADGAFYEFPDIGALLGTDLAGRRPESSADLAAILLDEAMIAVVPGEPFGAPGHLRLSFALDEESMRRGLGRWAALYS